MTEAFMTAGATGPRGGADMTEEQWLQSDAVGALAAPFLGGLSGRKLLLYVCGNSRRVEAVAGHAEVAHLLAVAEQIAEDGNQAGVPRPVVLPVVGLEERLGYGGRGLLLQEVRIAINIAAGRLHYLPPPSFELAGKRLQSELFRDVFGNPFRLVTLAPGWRTHTVASLAQAAYEERDLPSGELEPARLAILADALEEAGCTNEDILTHLRSPGPHVRGCWALDLVLGKE